MGFDNECILNIQSLAGEYFCPVCRTLVYPNEALQSQCTHLYCKPCLAYVVSSTQACPYDGYLVTEAGSKPLTETNKALAETIGKTPVHCLYHRSGCTWQGSLSECTSHCAGCSYGNSPVVCNRCGVQIVHRQVQEHAQTCNVNGANVQTQPATTNVHDSATSVAAVASDPNKTGTQPGVQNAQSSATQTVAVPLPGQNLNQLGIVNPQPQVVAPNAVPTPEQWYQYQQYYQQYPGYDPYQQAFQQYYPYQPQAGPQIQQHPPLAQGQPHPHTQPHPQLQPTQPLAQVQPQPQSQLPAHSHPQSQNVPHGQPQPHPYPQAPAATQNQNQAQPNQPLHFHPGQPHAQVQAQPHGSHPPPPPPPHGPLPPQPYPQAQPNSLQTHPQQQMQGPQIQYQLAHPQVHHPHAPSQPQPQLQPHAQGHPQAQYPSHSQQHPLPPPPQASQPPTLNAPPPNQHSSIQSVTGHHSYQQPHGQQQMQQAPPQQYPQPPAHMRPPQPHAFPPNQQPPVLLPSQGQASSIPPAQQHIYPNNQQTGPSLHQRPVMQPQQHMPPQYVQQAPPFAGQLSTQVHNPLNTGHFTQQQPQLRPQGPPQAMQQYPPPHIQPQHYQSHAARPSLPNQSGQLQQFPQSTGALGAPPQLIPPQHNSNQLSATPSYVNASNNQLQASSEQPSVQSGFLANTQADERKVDHTSDKSVEHSDAGSPSQKSLEKNVTGLGADLAEGKSDPGMKAVGDEHQPRSEGDDSYKHEERKMKDASEGYQGQRPNEEGTESTMEPSTDGGNAGKSQATGASLKQAEKNVANASLQSSTEGNKTGGSQAVNGRDHLHHGPVGDESGGFQGKGFEQTSHPSQFSDHGRRQLPPMPYGPSSHQQRPSVPLMSQAVPPTGPPFDGRLPGHPPAVSLGPGNMPQPGQVLNPPAHLQPPALNQPGSFHPDNLLGGVPEPGSTASYGRGPSQFGSTQRSVELQHGTPPGQYQGSAPPSHAGISRMSQGEPVGPPMGAVPPASFESHGQLMVRAPTLRGPEGYSGPPRPITPMEGDMFSSHRTPHFDSRRSDSLLPGSLDKGPFGQPFGSESNPMGMNGAFGGMRDERFKAIEERSNPFSMGPNRRLDQPEFQDSVNQHPRPMDRGPPRNHDKASHAYDARQNVEPGPPGGPVGFLPPYRPGALHPNDSGERGWAVGNYDDNRGRSDLGQSNPDFPGPVPGFNRHHMEGFPPRSPGRENFGNHSRPFGGFSDGIDDMGGRDRPGSFNLPSDSGGHSLHENRFPIGPPGHMRRREFEGPGNLQMGEHMRSGDSGRQDVLPSHLRRGELFNPGNVSGHPPLGEPGFDSFGHGRMNESAGPGGFPHRPFGEPFGMSSHPRLGEPGFRSSYTRQGFPNDGGPFAGDSDSFDRFRKRNPVSTGWCRICRVDCETVEGLDMHSQTREHQKMTMDMVISIKEKNGKRQKTSKDHSAREEVNKSRNVGFSGRGKKP